MFLPRAVTIAEGARPVGAPDAHTAAVADLAYNVVAGNLASAPGASASADARENFGGRVRAASNHPSSFDPWPPENRCGRRGCARGRAELYWFPLNKLIDGAGVLGTRATRPRDRDSRPLREGNVVAMFPEEHAVDS